MRRLAGITLVATLVLSGAASAALAPGPDIFDFEPYANVAAESMYPMSGVTFAAPSGFCQGTGASGGHDGGVYVRTDCSGPSRGSSPPTFAIGFTSSPRSIVELFVRVSGSSPSPSSLVVTACGPDPCVERRFSSPPTDWTPVVLRAPSGAAPIDRVTVDTSFSQVHVDDVGLSTGPQPDTEIVSGPGSPTSATSASFAFAANQPGATFNCTLDGRALDACPAPTLSGLADGTHDLVVSAVDRWGLVDSSPATHTWTVDTTRPTGPSADNCPTVENPDQADTDRDNVGDACELLPSGNLPPLAGQRVTVRLESGEVFVRLPRRGVARQSAQAGSGFVPLKGVASVPVGSTVDARRGTLFVQSAANARGPGASGRRLQAAVISAGIFRIRQARRARRRARTATIPTDAVLSSAAGAQRVCAGSRPSNPRKGIVRTLRVSSKGIFRTVGGASVVTGRNATWNITDRCDGTLTQVGRGRVTVARTARGKRPVVVTAGRAYLTRALLFAIKKGRRG